MMNQSLIKRNRSRLRSKSCIVQSPSFRQAPKAPVKQRKKRCVMLKERHNQNICDYSFDDLSAFLTSPIPMKETNISNKCNPRNPNLRRKTFKNCGFIAKGSFGIVCNVETILDENNNDNEYNLIPENVPLALKIGRNTTNPNDFMMERNILKRLQSAKYHINICRCFSYGFDEESKLYQLFESYKHGTLEDLIKCQDKQLNSYQIFQILLQINNGLIHIHKNEIVHLDIKPENIFIDINFEYNAYCLKIGDFGISTDLAEGEYNYNNKKVLKLASGDPIYIAPEILTTISNIYDLDKYNKEDLKKIDIFSLGIIILEILYDIKLPSKGELFTYLRNIDKTKQIEWNQFGEIENELNDNSYNKIKDILWTMLYKNASDRISSEDLLQKIEILFDENNNKAFDFKQKSFGELLQLKASPININDEMDEFELDSVKLSMIDDYNDITKDVFIFDIDITETFEHVPEEVAMFVDWTSVHTEEQLNTAFLITS